MFLVKDLARPNRTILYMKYSQLLIFLLLQLILSATSFANNPGISYQGRIFKPDGNPLEGTTVQFRMQVRSPGSENCLLYEEVQTLNMAGSAGVFALTLNDGTGTRLDAATYQVDRIFANRDTMTLDATRCTAGTTYTPNSADGRKLVVYFKDETMTAYEAMPLMNLNYVPQAMYALEAQKVDKFAVSNILRAVDGSGNPVAAPALNPTQLVNLNTLLATPAANYVQTTTNGSAALPVVAGNPSSGLAAGQIWYDSGSNVMKYYDGAVKTFGTSGGGVTSVATGTGLTGGPITTTGTINVDVGVTTGKIVQVAASNKLPVIDGSNLTNITATDATKLPLAGGTMTGPLVNSSNSASTALAVTQASTGYAASFMGGNVGIGTTVPETLLSLANTGVLQFGSTTDTNYAQLSRNNLSFYRNDNLFSFINQKGIGSGILIRTSQAATSDTQAVAILANGNVGIGTTTPSSALHVVGAAGTVGSPNGGSGLTVVGGSAYALGNGNGGNLSLTGGAAAGTGTGGDISITSGAGTNPSFTRAGNIVIAPGTGWSPASTSIYGGNYAGLGAPSLTLGGTSSITTGSVTLRSSDSTPAAGATGNLSLLTGTVGGTLSSANAGNISIVAGNGGNALSLGGSVSITAGNGGAANNSGANVTINPGAKGGAASDGNIILANLQGNVGIGTASPGSRLTIKSQADSATILSGRNEYDQEIAKILVGGTGTHDGTFSILTGSGTVKASMSANALGQPVLYGNSYSTNKPDGTTSVYGAALALVSPLPIGEENGIFFSNSQTSSNAPGGAITFYTTDNGGYGRGGLKFKTSDSGSVTTRMTINSTGSIGVGTTTPQATLDVNGYVKLKSNGSEPVACSGTTAGSIAMTSSYVPCVCNGTAWYYLDSLRSGVVACVW
jgi:hypothetical protein